MAQVTVSNVSFRGMVAAVPGPALTVADIGKAFPSEDAAKVANLVGLEQLYRAKPGQTSADLCIEAARHLLAKMDWTPDTVGGIILVTQSPDYFLPNSASVVHAALGLPKSCFAFDVNMGCSGFVYGLWMASQFISGGTVRRVLVLVGDTLSQVASPEDRSGMLFGDAGSAAALEWDAAAEPTSFVLGSDGNGAQNLIIPAGAFRSKGSEPDTTRIKDSEGNSRSPFDVAMNGWEVFNFTIREVPGLVSAVLEQHHWTRDDVDLFLFHQANKMMVQHLIRKCRIEAEKAPINIGRYGNTSGVTIPLLMADDAATTLREKEQKLLLVAFGVGYAWAAAALTTKRFTVAEVINVLD